MREDLVKDIYDKLYGLESKRNNKDAYPIHKKLVFSKNGINDIYEWLNDNEDFLPEMKILDAGCGVGYGSCLLAAENEIHVTGISLSQKEIDLATRYSVKKGVSNKVNFVCKSFDTIAPTSYDIIIAVESLKHSIDLNNTLKILKEALNKNGQLIIIEDYYQNSELVNYAERYVNDWNLVDAFRLEDYYNILEMPYCKYTDLTKYMPVKSEKSTNMKLRFSNVMHFIKGKKDMDIYKIFRGGYYLDKLYASKIMKYGVLKYTKP